MEVEVGFSGGVGALTLNRPLRRNAMTTRSMAEFAEGYASLAARADCRVILLRGAGGHFCSGWDTSEFAGLVAQDDASLADAFRANLALLDAIADSPKLTIAAVEGACMGFGLSLAARVDIAVASETARFALPELLHGVAPGMTLGDAVRALGRRNAMDWALSCETKTARDALAAGLVSRVAADDAFEGAISALTARLAALDPDAARATKKLARDMEAGRATDADAIAISIASLRAAARRPR
jgi:enoyl-CoA hydratase/carnithine racemase